MLLAELKKLVGSGGRWPAPNSIAALMPCAVPCLSPAAAAADSGSVGSVLALTTTVEPKSGAVLLKPLLLACSSPASSSSPPPTRLHRLRMSCENVSPGTTAPLCMRRLLAASPAAEKEAGPPALHHKVGSEGASVTLTRNLRHQEPTLSRRACLPVMRTHMHASHRGSWQRARWASARPAQAAAPPRPPPTCLPPLPEPAAPRPQRRSRGRGCHPPHPTCLPWRRHRGRCPEASRAPTRGAECVAPAVATCPGM